MAEGTGYPDGWSGARCPLFNNKVGFALSLSRVGLITRSGRCSAVRTGGGQWRINQLSTISVVAISAFSVLFLLLLVVAAASVVYANLRVHRLIENFTLLVRETSGKLDSNHTRMETLVSNIRGDKIEKAIQEFLSIVPTFAKIATRNEQAVVLFSQLVKALTEEQGISGSDIERARASGLGPESYAPAAPGEHYVSRSRVAASDAEVLAEEVADNSQTFDGEL